MNEDPLSRNTPQRSWLERLSDALLREPQDRVQLVELLRDAENRDLLNADALSMIEGVLQVSEMQARDIMVPRSHMVVVEEDQKPSEFLPFIIESTHSRFPVIGEDRDEIIGILHAKDLLKYSFTNGDDDFHIKDILRSATFIPESKRLDILLTEFRASHNHMAMVVDEYGGTSGLVTIEDVLEQIVGEIEDEFDVEEEAVIQKLSDTNYTIKALTPIEAFNDYFDTNFSDEEFDTIGGLVTNHFGHLPKQNEVIILDSFEFKVLQSDNRRIGSLQLTVLTPSEQTESA